MTLTDEGTIDAGVAKRRQTKIYSDVLGRTVKTEILNWQGGSVYSATVNTYNARDQVTQVREYAGAEGSGTYQDTSMTYDGYGRLKTQHVPEQNAGTSTTWDYNADDTIQKVTDARGAATNYSYNNRHLVTAVSYTVPSGSQISVPTAASYSYDAAGNRSTMTDGTGSMNYSYDSLSRLTSESRTFTDLTGSTYSLNYSYNLANALTSLNIPFRSRQIGYNYDTAGRLSAVTATGFSATYNVWPNQYTQNLTSFVSNITYRAWSAPKSMTYGNATSEQTTYNSRLQPSSYTLNNMNYQNTNICCSYPTYSTMTWNYGYYNDGTLEHAWDSTNEWFDRAYKYDHASRLKEASTFRRARGLSPYPTIAYPDPYFQSITYDAFNHSNRTGRLYIGEPSDIGTYVNNRRNGWQYDADGNPTTDSSYQQTIDAAGMTIRSVSLAKVGDGNQYPLQPRLDITQTYDANGTPAKRVQISRLPGIVDEFGNPGEPIEDTQTTHYIKSSVLGGATVAELGWGDTIHIYAGGQRIAREFLGNVTFEHHNPMTGSWVTSHGHSSYRTTNREERDPRGAETPLSNPYGSAENYVDWRFGQPLFVEGGDPFDYHSGREIDGLPVTEAEFQRRLASGSLQTEYPGRYAYPGRPQPIKKTIIEHGLGMYEIFIPSLLRDDRRPPGGWVLFLAEPQESDRLPGGNQTACKVMADVAEDSTENVGSDPKEALLNFDKEFSRLYHGGPITSIADAQKYAPGNLREINPYYASNASGFKEEYRDTGTEPHPIGGRHSDQTHHFSAYLSMGINGRVDIYLAGQHGLRPELRLPRSDNAGDKRLGQAAFEYGLSLRRDPKKLSGIGDWIRKNICNREGEGLYSRIA